MALSIIILAAGNGKRMHSTLPKVLHCLAGIPLLQHVISTAQALSPDDIFVVYGSGGESVREQLGQNPVKWVKQEQARGTGHAVLQALPLINENNRILVLYGDVPLIKPTTLEELVLATKLDQIGLLVAKSENSDGLGRIIRNSLNNIIAIKEQKDATTEEQKIQEIHTGILTTPVNLLKRWLPALHNNNAQGEYYLTDIVAMAVNEGVPIIGLTVCSKEVSGINDRSELISLERYYQEKKAHEFLMQGVTIMDPTRFDCRGQVEIAKDVFIDVNVVLTGKIAVAEGTVIGPNNYLKNVSIGKGVTILPNCVIEDAIIGDNCVVGPFTRIRPKTVLHDNVHVGNFVELKNTEIGDGSKTNHLSYLGDAILGKNVNVGAGTITCNYDGECKFPTTIEDGAFIGSGTELVAPIKIGKKAYIGAGSTITRDAPEEQLTLGRARQVTVESWKKKS
jgi:bifunctional UDP-N-acetylglucosamine pyrophosphorylase / glucosamine-1-phosphate N-acetyltransferase